MHGRHGGTTKNDQGNHNPSYQHVASCTSTGDVDIEVDILVDLVIDSAIHGIIFLVLDKMA